ncbi:hypothetical protein RKD26_001338 [Streptomyces calvus]
MTANDVLDAYEAPQLVEVGDFSDLTLGAPLTDCMDWLGTSAWVC